jgi:hypothetical protein
MTEDPFDRALAVIRAYSGKGGTGGTGGTEPSGSSKIKNLAAVPPVPPLEFKGGSRGTNNSADKSVACSFVPPVPPVPPQKPIPGKTENSVPIPYAEALSELSLQCPEFVDHNRWQQCLADGRAFVGGRWGRQAEALGWTSGDLFGLHEPPENPRPTYDRLARRDHIGLAWILQGRGVTAMSSTVGRQSRTTAA